MHRTLPRAFRFTLLCCALALAVLFLTSARHGQPIDAASAAYTLTFSSAAPRHIHVVARLPMVTDTLTMSPVMAELPNGYATFVHNLDVLDGSKRIHVRALSAGRWVIEAKRPPTVTLTYDVVIAHDTVHWNVSSAFARGYSTAGTVFFVGRAVFISSSATGQRPVRVHVVLPPAWRFVAPYDAVAAEPLTYEAKNLNDLWANVCIAGPLAIENASIGDLKITFAGAESMHSGLALLSTSLTPVVETFAKMVGPAPTGRMVIIANVATGGLFTGGEALTRSLSLLVASVPQRSTRGQWEYLLAHEMFHQWNPHAFPPADQSKFEWLVEGFTDYMTRLALVRTGVDTDAEFRSAMATSYRLYLEVAGRIALRDAGGNKGRNYDLIYAGGTSLAAALDAELRRRTKGASGVPQLLARMYADYRRTHHAYDYDDFVRTASAVAGSNMAPFFARFVVGRDTIPIS